MKLYLAACFFLFFFQSTHLCLAGETLIKPFLKSKIEFNDNLFFSRENSESDFVLLLAPSLNMQYVSETTQVSTGISGDFYRYRDNSILDDTYYAADFSSRFRLSEKTGFSTDISLVKERSLDSELVSTGTITGVNEKDINNLGFGLSHMFSEGFEVNIEGRYSKTDYESLLSTDYEGKYLSAAFYKRLSSVVDALVIQTYYSGYSTTFSDVDSLGVFMGWSHAFNETLSISCQVGVRHTETTFFIYNEKDYGGIANISIEKSGETWQSNASLRRDLKFGSYGEPVENDQLKIRFRKNLSDSLRYIISGNVNRSESSGAFRERDTIYYNISNAIEYKLNKNITLRGSYSYASHYDDLRTEEKTVDRNILFISLVFNLEPIF